MRLEIASNKAVKYACLNFHYAKAVPNVGLAYNVFNKNNEWCGVICYGIGATNNIAEPYNLKQGEVIELVRMALNGKQDSTTKAMAISLKLIKKNAPNVKLIVSYADSEQGHFGTIYQATNWFYSGFSVDTNLIINGKRKHRRTLGSKYGTCSALELRKKGLNVEVIKTKPKWKYIYPIDKSLIPLCKSLSKPYPKQAVEVHKLNSSQSSEKVGGANPTQPL
ncbi:MAG: hypothetical protein ACOVOQ_14235 [Flavobacterium sp.]